MNFDDKIGSLYGVGPKYEKCFNQNGIYTVGDLLYYFPRAYQNRGDICRIIDTPFDFMPHSYVLTIATEPKVAMVRRGMNILKFKAFDESGTVNITYFNQNYLKDVFTIGSTFRFWGKITREKRTLSMSSPAYEPIVPFKKLLPLVPVYPLFYGINQKFIGKLISEILSDINGLTEEYLPDSVLDRVNLCSLPFALKNIHIPYDENALNASIRRLSFDELFLFAMAVSRIKSSQKSVLAPAIADTDITDFIKMIPYELTDAQARAVGEILLDLNGNGENTLMGYTKAMNRIVVGDVGSGKTICAALAAYAMCKNGFQAALMVPTEILASQHYESLSPYFDRLGFRCELLTGSTPAKSKREILTRLASGKTNFIIGTHALIQDGVSFNNLGLVITDEQHRFGVRQRAKLAEKSQSAHVLVMSATPIPRTLSLMVYGDLDISLIDSMPPGRKRVDTFVVDESYRERLNGFISKQVAEGHQVYIVCPAVEEKKDDILDAYDYNPFVIEDKKSYSDMKAAVDYAKELKDVFPELTVEFIHGKLKGKDKDRIMMDFASGKINILVSTTVIEVGVNVPNATLMIVENAERFGLSQLHQLRGRVGRESAKSYCVLVSSSKGSTSRERLEIMRTTYDGYTIAEHDLKMRGPGDFFSADPSIRQSGEVGLNISKSCSDTELLNTAFECAREILSIDKNLDLPEHQAIKSRAAQIYESNTRTIN